MLSAEIRGGSRTAVPFNEAGAGFPAPESPTYVGTSADTTNVDQRARPHKLAPSLIAQGKRRIFSPRMELPTKERCMLAALLEHADAEGVCWPSHSRVASCTGLSLSSVKRAQERLAARGLLCVSRVMPGRRLPNGRRVVGSGVLYTLALDVLGLAKSTAQNEPSRELISSDVTPQIPAENDTSLFLPVKLTRSEPHASERPAAAERAAAPEASACVQSVGTTAMVLLAYWWRAFLAAGHGADAKACVFYDDVDAALVQRRLSEGFTAEEIRSAFDGAAADAWRREAAHRTGIRVLLRDGATIYALAKAGRAAAEREAKKQAHEEARRRRQSVELRTVAPVVDIEMQRAGAGALLAALGGAA